MSYPIHSIGEIDAEIAGALKAAGIRSTGRLLERACTQKGRKELAEKTGLDAKKLLCWANMADRMRIKGVSRDYALLLGAVGVDTVKELRYRNAARLAAAMAEANKRHKLVRLLPSDAVVGRWIACAKALEQKITY